MTKSEFLKDVANWSNHRFLLWPALQVTKDLGLPVLELGCGEGSTPFLKQFCDENSLQLVSYDFHPEWAAKYSAIHVTDWETIDWARQYGVALTDESPGEQRRISITKLHHVKVLVGHDTELAADHGYQMRTPMQAYKYFVDHKSDGAWASACSDFIDVTKFEI